MGNGPDAVVYAAMIHAKEVLTIFLHAGRFVGE